MSIIEQITEWLIGKGRVQTIELGFSGLVYVAEETGKPRTIQQITAEMPFFSKEQDSYQLDSAILTRSMLEIKRKKLQSEIYANIILPDWLFLFGALKIPAVAVKSGYSNLIEREVQKNAMHPYSEYIVKHETGEKKDGKQMIHYCALHQSILTKLLQACSDSGIVVTAIPPAFTGLTRLLCLRQGEHTHPSVFLHIDEEATTMGIFNQNGLLAINLVKTGINHLLAAIGQQMSLDIISARQTLFNEPLILDDPAITDAQFEIQSYTAIEPILAELLQKIYGLLLLYSTENQQQSGYVKIYLCGPGAEIKNIDRLLSFNLGLPAVTISSEFSDIPANDAGIVKDKAFAAFATVAGNIAMQPSQLDRYDRIMAA